MELRHLRYLVAVADAGTFVRAAELLRVAQPALSRQINDLEDELKVPLFDDSARKATLTDAGHAAVRIARHVISDTERAVARARMSEQGLLGSFTLSAGPVPLMSGLVPQLIARMRMRHPSVTIAIREAAFPQQWDDVTEGRSDLLLGAAPPVQYQSLSVETQMPMTVDVALLPPNHPIGEKETIRLKDLEGMTYLGLDFDSPDIEAAREMLLREFKRQKIKVGPVRLLASLESALIHVQAGQGWTLMPAIFARTVALRGRRIEDFQAPFRTVRAWRRADKRAITRTVLTELRAIQQEGFIDSSKVLEAPHPPSQREFVPVRLDLRHLRSFVEVAELGSLGRAAESLEITQPALSRQMRELEYDVGVTLLERQTRGVELTAAGRALHSDAQGVLAVVDRLPADVRRAKRGSEERRCVVAAVPHPGVHEILARVITEMEGRTPRVRVGTRGISTPNIPALLRRSEVDIALGFVIPARTAADSEVARVRLMDDELCYAVLPKTHPLAKEEVLTLKDLQYVPFIFPSREETPPFYDVMMHHLDEAGARPRTHLAYSGIKTITAMIAQGLGWTAGARSFIGHEPAGTAFVRVSDLRLPWGVELLYRKDESRAAILATIDAVIEVADHLYTQGLTSGAPSLPAINTRKAAIS